MDVSKQCGGFNAWKGHVMIKFTTALREIGTYKEVLRSQVEHLLNDRLLSFVNVDAHDVKAESPELCKVCGGNRRKTFSIIRCSLVGSHMIALAFQVQVLYADEHLSTTIFTSSCH
ncbi:hypothetical protein L1049_019392 [Liquidambar formosana]|uniref:Uncharacterized protein n=1 Tax=Liquidambar formosana TaxID=63359 RepID=A0AAP0X307_LIQFO